ncbi:hypothetical protein FB192DRAFT_1169920 [Mucor lusitanicus]|uniref:RecF/RecN/SMC N-terminal domain-containing protein n=1 Tax=Mucor circinelloides f. lusitanicus TaxID=29924 RepID=A0A8H4BA77_MUCCL|nr:hypothetical protein FB192DRAFT_1169920 [Mucor lusitanicus]
MSLLVEMALVKVTFLQVSSAICPIHERETHQPLTPTAIRFVLGDAYQNLTKEERQALLHEGVGTATISAYVEIIFDNADNRFPTGKERVILRRSIGLTLDEYSLDGKATSKSDVNSFLESAGFSRANPYYIVPQGRVTSLTTAKDEDRLKLIKEIAARKDRPSVGLH